MAQEVIAAVKNFVQNEREKNDAIYQLGVLTAEPTAKRLGISPESLWMFTLAMMKVLRPALKNPNDPGTIIAVQMMFALFEELDIVHWEKVETLFS